MQDKFIRRTGKEGNYTYWYQDRTGRIYFSKFPPSMR